MDNTLIKKTKNTFTVSEVALACSVFIVLNFIFLQLFYALPAPLKTMPVVYIASFLLEAMFGIASLIVAKFKSIDIFREAGFNKKVNGKIVLYGLLIALASLYLFGMLTYSFMDLLVMMGYKPVENNIVINNFGVYLVYIVTTCAAPALFEEMLFRGVVATGLKEFGKKMAIVLSSLVFMLMHGLPDQTVHQFIVGAVLGYLFISSGNIWLGIIVHFFNNFISVTSLFVSTIFSNPEAAADVATDVVETATNVDFSTFFVELLLALVLAAVGYYVIKYLANLMLKEDENINGKASTINIAESLVGAGEVVNVEVSSETNENDSQNKESKVAQNEGSVNPNEFAINDNNIETMVSANDNINAENQTLSENATDGENAESEEINAVETAVAETKKEMPMSTLIMIILSGGYLVFEWLLAFVQGFMR
ncbi:MAG: CPBP family intramembrane metalloprotease [Clostridia bacterium]|nr:CPBP family intramembrane metalloprotease [Clostridia bacterium]